MKYSRDKIVDMAKKFEPDDREEKIKSAEAALYQEYGSARFEFDSDYAPNGRWKDRGHDAAVNNETVKALLAFLESLDRDDGLWNSIHTVKNQYDSWAKTEAKRIGVEFEEAPKKVKIAAPPRPKKEFEEEMVEVQVGTKVVYQKLVYTVDEIMEPDEDDEEDGGNEVRLTREGGKTLIAVIDEVEALNEDFVSDSGIINPKDRVEDMRGRSGKVTKINKTDKTAYVQFDGEKKPEWVDLLLLALEEENEDEEVEEDDDE